LLSDDRFELGIGSGRPDVEREAAQLGMPWGSAGDRIRQVEQVIAAVREQVSPTQQIVVTAVGPRMLASAARTADRIGLAIPPQASEEELGAAATRARDAAAGPISLSQQLTGLAGRLPQWLSHSGLNPESLAGTAGMLTGDVAQMVDTLLQRQETTGIDEFIVPGELAEYFAPVINRIRR